MIKTRNEREKSLVRITRDSVERARKNDYAHFNIYVGELNGIFSAMYYLGMIKEPICFCNIEQFESEMEYLGW